MKKIFTLFTALAMVVSMSAESWTVAGTPALIFGTEWDPSNATNVMVNHNGTYKWEKSNLTLAASTIEFKVVKGNTWGEEYPSSNYQLKITESGVYRVTITFNESSKDVTAVATKQSDVEVIPTIAIAGDMNGWSTSTSEFVIAEDKKTASLTLALEAIDYGFKIIIAGGWTSDGNVVTRENNTTVFTGANNDANCTLSADVAGDYTFTWTYATNTLEVAYPEASDTPVDPTPGSTEVAYVLMGVGGDWETGIALSANPENENEYILLNQPIEKDDAVKVVTLTDGVATAYCGTVDEWSVVHEHDKNGNIILAPGTYDFYYKVDEDIIYIGTTRSIDPTPDPGNGVTYNVTVPAGTNACYIVGEMNTWSHQEMTKVSDTHYTITIAEATTTMMYKYCSGPNWDYVEMQVDGVTDVQNRTYAESDVVVAWKAVYDPDGIQVDPTAITYVLMGVGGDWETGIALTRNETALEEEYVLLGQAIAEGDAVKVVTLIAGVATIWCGNVDKASTVSYTTDPEYCNIILDPGTYDFHYKVAANIIYITASVTTLVENITLEKRHTKIIRNGQMCILRDGVLYDIVGQIVK